MDINLLFVSDSHRFQKNNVQTVKVVISVYEGYLVNGFKHHTPLTSAFVERSSLTSGVHRVEVTEGGIKGTLFIPPGVKIYFKIYFNGC